jgi:hypothetical protein
MTRFAENTSSFASTTKPKRAHVKKKRFPTSTMKTLTLKSSVLASSLLVALWYGRILVGGSSELTGELSQGEELEESRGT